MEIILSSKKDSPMYYSDVLLSNHPTFYISFLCLFIVTKAGLIQGVGQWQCASPTSYYREYNWPMAPPWKSMLVLASRLLCHGWFQPMTECSRDTKGRYHSTEIWDVCWQLCLEDSLMDLLKLYGMPPNILSHSPSLWVRLADLSDGSPSLLWVAPHFLSHRYLSWIEPFLHV